MKKEWILAIAIALAFGGCATKSPCPKVPNPGSLGAVFNSQDDEYSPFFFNDTLFYTATSKEKKKTETIYKSYFRDGRFSRPVRDTTLPLKSYQNAGLPVFWTNPESGEDEIFFAAIHKNGKINRNLFTASKSEDKWNKANMISELNTSSYESHPFISKDGRWLLFSSDREGGKGGIDLYIAERSEDGSWGEARNLDINTPANEITPFIAEDGSLYFASQGYSEKKDYEIIKAEPLAEGSWGKARPLMFPINTEFDETGPAIFRNRLFLASNRRGGCGGIDLYAFELCGPVTIESIVVSSIPNFPLAGTANLYDETGRLVSSSRVGDQGLIKFNLMPMEKYNIEYINDCHPEFKGIKEFMAPCSDSNVVVIKTMFEFTPQEEYNLVEVKVPFFVSGYYMPNTRENLEALRLKFAYNLIGTDSKTRYIELPGDKYDSFSNEVEKSLNEASEFLYNIIAGMKDDCFRESDSKIMIHITGFADPRPISPDAEYADADISDEMFNFTVFRGKTMDNLLLSELRAYYTAKYFERYISQKDKTGIINNRIVWKIEGKGVDETQGKPDNIKRRVNIKIKPMS